MVRQQWLSVGLMFDDFLIQVFAGAKGDFGSQRQFLMSRNFNRTNSPPARGAGISLAAEERSCLQMANHPRTDMGVRSFISDWKTRLLKWKRAHRWPTALKRVCGKASRV